MKVRLAQINPIVGNLKYNTGLIKDVINSSKEFDIIVFPELSLTGYPPQDLLLDKKFILGTQEALIDIKNIVDMAAEVGWKYDKSADLTPFGFPHAFILFFTRMSGQLPSLEV